MEGAGKNTAFVFCLHCLFVAKTLPLPCVFTAFVAKTLPFLAGFQDTATSILKLMGERGLQPDVHTCNAAAQCFAHASPGRPADVEGIIDTYMGGGGGGSGGGGGEVEAEAGAGSAAGVVGPNAQTFSLLALAYGRQRPPAPQLAEAVLNRMIEAGVQPNAASINAVLQVRAAPCPCLWTPPNHPAAAAAAAAGRRTQASGQPVSTTSSASCCAGPTCVFVTISASLRPSGAESKHAAAAATAAAAHAAAAATAAASCRPAGCRGVSGQRELQLADPRIRERPVQAAADAGRGRERKRPTI